MYTIALGALRSMHMTSQPMYIASASNWLIGLLLGYFLTFRLEWDIAGYVVCKNCCPKEESRALMIAGINALCKGLFGYSSRARLLRKRLYVFYCSCWGGLWVCSFLISPMLWELGVLLSTISLFLLCLGHDNPRKSV